jgi:hypothetical protein
VVRILDPHYISCILYQSMLKASSGGKKRVPIFTGKLNR